MSFTKSKIVVIIAGLVMLTAVFGGWEAQTAMAQTKPVYPYSPKLPRRTSPGAYREIADVWEAFEKANPNIEIEREDLFLEPFHQKTEAYAAAGRLPDVLYMWPGGRSTTLHTKRLVKDLAPLLGDTRRELPRQP